MKIDGIELLNPHLDMVAKSILSGPWESYSRVVWKNAVESLPSQSVVWDVGAYTGYYAMVAATRQDLNVVAFEPHPNIFKALVDNVHHNKMHNINCMNVALGDKVFETAINVTNNIALPSGSSVVDIGKNIVATVPIKVASGDYIATDEDSMPSLIKIDVEEYEYQVLEGLRTILSTKKPVILIEILREVNVSKVASFLSDFGYTVQRINENGANFSAPFSPSDRNYLCVPN